MGRIILFDRPIWMASDSRIKRGKRPILEIYGFISKVDCDDSDMNEYISYLCGCSQWQQEGNRIAKHSAWVSKEGRYYNVEHPFVETYCRKARKKMAIKWVSIKTNKRLVKNKAGTTNNFIVNRSLYNKLLKYGTLVDVRNLKDKKWKTSTKGVKWGQK